VSRQSAHRVCCLNVLATEAMPFTPSGSNRSCLAATYFPYPTDRRHRRQQESVAFDSHVILCSIRSQLTDWRSFGVVTLLGTLAPAADRARLALRRLRGDVPRAIASGVSAETSGHAADRRAYRSRVPAETLLLAQGHWVLRLAEPLLGAAVPAVAVSPGEWVHPTAAGSRP
jgi:hypothetical protein